MSNVIICLNKRFAVKNCGLSHLNLIFDFKNQNVKIQSPDSRPQKVGSSLQDDYLCTFF